MTTPVPTDLKWLREALEIPTKAIVNDWTKTAWEELSGNAQYVNASNQVLYSSNQAFKWDPSLVTANERGLSIAGVEVFRFPWIDSLESSRFSAEGRERRREAEQLRAVEEAKEARRQADMRRLDDSFAVLRRHVGILERVTERHDNAVRRMDGDLRTVGATTRRHDTAIRGLLSNQGKLAATARGEAGRGADRADSRSQQRRNVVAPGRRAAAEREAAQLRTVATALRQVEQETRRLEGQL